MVQSRPPRCGGLPAAGGCGRARRAGRWQWAFTGAGGGRVAWGGGRSRGPRPMPRTLSAALRATVTRPCRAA